MPCYKLSPVLILAFDTATDVATSALVSDGEVLGERASVAKTLLEDVREAVAAREAAEKLLSNPVIEDFAVHVEEHEGSPA